MRPLEREPALRVATYSLVAAFLLPGLLSCSRDRAATEPSEPPIQEQVLPADPNGILLPGEESSAVRSAGITMLPSPVAPSEITEEGYRLSRITAVVAPEVSVGELNAALIDLDARVISTSSGRGWMTLRIDPAATTADLLDRVEQVQASPVFIFAQPSRVASASSGSGQPLPLRELPPNGDAYEFQEKARIPALWNLNAAHHTDDASCIITASFGSGTGAAGMSAFIATPGSSSAPSSTARAAWLSASLVCADWDSEAPGVQPGLGGDVVGLGSYGLDLVELSLELANFVRLGLEADENSLLTILSTETFHSNDSPAFRAFAAFSWLTEWHATSGLRGAVHIVDAGTTANGESAAVTSPWALAASGQLTTMISQLGPDEREALGFAFSSDGVLPNLDSASNVLTVGGRNLDGSAPGAVPGQDVVAFQDVVGLCIGSGCTEATTAGSAPQHAAALVAGLAYRIRSMAREMSPSAVLERIRLANAESTVNGSLDFYVAALSVDQDLLEGSMRHTLLDVVTSGSGAAEPDGRIDETDIEEFLRQFQHFEEQRANGNDLADHSRFDLNGDGYTGGTTTAKFDLDANSPPQFTNLQLETELGFTQSYDETALTDAEILCYYAQSAMYSGSTESLDILNELEGCTELAILVEVENPLPVSVTVPVRILVGRREADGVVGVPDTDLSLQSENALLGAVTGTTDDEGVFETTVRAMDADSVRLVIEAVAPNGDENERRISIPVASSGVRVGLPPAWPRVGQAASVPVFFYRNGDTSDRLLDHDVSLIATGAVTSPGTGVTDASDGRWTFEMTPVAAAVELRFHLTSPSGTQITLPPVTVDMAPDAAAEVTNSGVWIRAGLFPGISTVCSGSECGELSDSFTDELVRPCRFAEDEAVRMQRDVSGSVAPTIISTSQDEITVELQSRVDLSLSSSRDDGFNPHQCDYGATVAWIEAQSGVSVEGFIFARGPGTVRLTVTDLSTSSLEDDRGESYCQEGRHDCLPEATLQANLRNFFLADGESSIELKTPSSQDVPFKLTIGAKATTHGIHIPGALVSQSEARYSVSVQFIPD